MDQHDMILNENKLFSTTSNNINKRPSIDLTHANSPAIHTEDDP
jgi:hypothetical protein